MKRAFLPGREHGAPEVGLHQEFWVTFGAASEAEGPVVLGPRAESDDQLTARVIGEHRAPLGTQLTVQGLTTIGVVDPLNEGEVGGT